MTEKTAEINMAIVPSHKDASDRVAKGKGSALDILVVKDEPTIVDGYEQLSDGQKCRVSVDEWRQMVTDVVEEERRCSRIEMAGELNLFWGQKLYNEHTKILSELREANFDLLLARRRAALWNTVAVVSLFLLIIFMVIIAVVVTRI